MQLMIGRPLAEYFAAAREDTSSSDELLRVEGLSLPAKVRGRVVLASRGRGRGTRGAGRRRAVGCRGDAVRRASRATAGRIFVRGRDVRDRRARATRFALGSASCRRTASGRGSCSRRAGVRNTSLPMLDRLSRCRGFVRREERELVARAFSDAARAHAEHRRAGRGAVGRESAEGRAGAVARRDVEDSDSRRADARRRRRRQGGDPRADRRAGGAGRRGSVISSELPECHCISHRILVLRQGQLVTEVAHAQATQELLLRLMAGGDKRKSSPTGGGHRSRHGRCRGRALLSWSSESPRQLLLGLVCRHIRGAGWVRRDAVTHPTPLDCVARSQPSNN